MRTRLLLNTVLFMLLLHANTYAQTFSNPLRGNAPDPTMAYYNGNYYLTFTGGSRLNMIKASTLDGLKTAPAVTVWQEAGARCCQMWAPALRFLNGKWYLYYCASDGVGANHRNYVLESTTADPIGPYMFKGKLRPTTQDGHAIDGNVLVKDNGQLFFCWASGGRIAIAQMSNPWTISSATAVIISTPTLSWEQQSGAINENPSFLKRNGKTFLFYSASH